MKNNNIYSSRKTINILLDLEGTCDYIDNELVKIFIEQIDTIRKKFKADSAIISISTHYNNSDKIKQVLDIINNNLSGNVEIGLSFYYGGIYDYYSNQMVFRNEAFNTDKLETFKEYYLENSSYDVKWIALIDDMLANESYKKFKDNYPVLVCKPSQRVINKAENNFMCMSSQLPGFYGIVENLYKYIDFIRHISCHKILEKQKRTKSHISQYELVDKIVTKDFTFIEENFNDLELSQSDCLSLLNFIFIIYNQKTLTDEDISHFTKISELVNDRIDVNDKESIEIMKQFRKIIEK